MTFIKTIPYRTILIILVCAIVFLPLGAKIGHNYSWLSTEKTLNNPTISKAINKETINNDIHNDIELKVDKVKNSDSLNINIIQTPANTQKPKNIIIKEQPKKKDSVKKSWVGRLLSKKKYK